MLRIEAEPIQFENYRERASQLRRLKHNSILLLFSGEHSDALKLASLYFFY